MNFPKSLTLVGGALATDGGSLFLEAHDEQSIPRSIGLDWSTYAHMEGTTALIVDCARVAKGTTEEKKWVEILLAAAVGEGHQKDGLESLRDGMVRLICSPDRDQKGPTQVIG